MKSRTATPTPFDGPENTKTTLAMINLSAAISENDVATVLSILESINRNVPTLKRRQSLFTHSNAIGISLFQQAIIEGRIEIVWALVGAFRRSGLLGQRSPMDAASYFHILFRRKRDHHTVDLLIALLQAGVNNFEAIDEHGQTPLRRAELTSSWWAEWHPKCVDILAACADNLEDHRRIGLTSDQVHIIRYEVYFQRSLVQMLIQEL